MISTTYFVQSKREIEFTEFDENNRKTVCEHLFALILAMLTRLEPGGSALRQALPRSAEEQVPPDQAGGLLVRLRLLLKKLLVQQLHRRRRRRPARTGGQNALVRFIKANIVPENGTCADNAERAGKTEAPTSRNEHQKKKLPRTSIGPERLETLRT